MATTTVISLYEDNAGGLYLVSTDAGRHIAAYAEVETLPDGSWMSDAVAMSDGDTDSWTLPQLTKHDLQALDATLVATHESCHAPHTCNKWMYSHDRMGEAAIRYIGEVD